MADFVKGLFGSQQPVRPAGDSDFADFAGAPEPSPAAPTPSSLVGNWFQPNPTSGVVVRPFTKWYRVWERTTPSDFYQEAVILPFMLVVIVLHAWGRRKNRRIARNWAAAHAEVLSNEFAEVGFDARQSPTVEQIEGEGLAKAMATSQGMADPATMLKEKTAQEFHCYATGRANTAFVDIKLHLFKRYNPLTLILEYVLSVLFESMTAPSERIDLVSYSFDGREKDLVPVATQAEQEELEAKSKGLSSSYDGFVWAVVHKDQMRGMRDERYDLSLTSTKDNPKLPNWATVMSESAEVTDLLLTPELLAALNNTGEAAFRSLIVSDQPLDKPTKLQDAVPRKRIALSLVLPPGAGSSPKAFDKTLPLFELFVRLPDTLATKAKFRSEVLRKIKLTRETEMDKLRKKDEEERAEERKLDADKKKKAERDAKLKGLSADEQRKFLDKEREKEQRKQTKKVTKRG